ncbi:hypothetical protein LEMLEM_LOCUS16757, partial [Lemmus lemmus]
MVLTLSKPTYTCWDVKLTLNLSKIHTNCLSHSMASKSMFYLKETTIPVPPLGLPVLAKKPTMGTWKTSCCQNPGGVEPPPQGGLPPTVWRDHSSFELPFHQTGLTFDFRLRSPVQTWKWATVGLNPILGHNS